MSSVAPDVTTEKSSLSKRITKDSLWLLAGYGVTAGSGFLFWILAARLIPPAQLGIDTAILSIVTATASLAASGLGNGILVMLPVAAGDRRGLLRTGMLTALGVAALLGVIAGVLAAVTLPISIHPVLTVLAVTLATVLWSAFTVLSPALTGLGQARWTLFVNGPTNIAKLALIPVLVATVGAANSPAVLATLIPAAVATAIVTIWVLPRLVKKAEATDEAAGTQATRSTAENRARFFSYVKRDGPATGLNVGIGFSLAFIVTAVAGPSQGALFALAWQFSMILDLVGVGFGSALAVHSANDTGQGRAVAVRLWLGVAGTVAVGTVLLVAASPLLFTLMGAFYLESGGVLVIAMLALASLFRTGYDIWCALLRAEHRVSRLLVFSVLDAALLIPLVVWFASMGGATGAAFAALLVAALFMVVGAVGILSRPRKTPPRMTIGRKRST